MPIVTAKAELPKSAPVMPTNDATRRSNIVEGEQGRAPQAEVNAQPEDPLSPKFAAMARKEKALRRQQQEFEAKVKAFEAQKSSSAPDYSNYVAKDKLKTDPWAVWNEIGLAPDDFAQMLANAPNQESQAIQKMQAKLQAIEEAQTNTQKQMVDKQQQDYEQAVSQIRTDITLMVDADPTYEMIKELGQQEAVVGVITETFASEGRLMSIDEAAKEVEEYLTEQAISMANLKKVKEKLAPVHQEQPKLMSTQKQISKTLTNSNIGTSKPMSARERAILAFKGELK